MFVAVVWGTLLIHPCALQVVRCVPCCSLATGVSRNLCREEEPSGSLVGRPRGISELLPRAWPGPKAQCGTARQRPWGGRAPPQQEAFHALGEPGQRAESWLILCNMIRTLTKTGSLSLPSGQSNCLKSLENKASEEASKWHQRKLVGPLGWSWCPREPEAAGGAVQANTGFLGLNLIT